VLMITAFWWSWSGVQAAEQTGVRVAALEQSLQSRAAKLADIRPVVRERQAHTQRAALIASLVSEHQQLPDLLWVLQSSPPAIQIEELRLSRNGGQWSGSLNGAAIAYNSATAAAAVNRFYKELARGRPSAMVDLTHLAYVEPSTLGASGSGAANPADGSVALAFGISFIVPLGEEQSP
jgi:hypothetical protein